MPEELTDIESIIGPTLPEALPQAEQSHITPELSSVSGKVINRGITRMNKKIEGKTGDELARIQAEDRGITPLRQINYILKTPDVSFTTPNEPDGFLILNEEGEESPLVVAGTSGESLSVVSWKRIEGENFICGVKEGDVVVDTVVSREAMVNAQLIVDADEILNSELLTDPEKQIFNEQITVLKGGDAFSEKTNEEKDMLLTEVNTLKIEVSGDIDEVEASLQAQLAKETNKEKKAAIGRKLAAVSLAKRADGDAGVLVREAVLREVQDPGYNEKAEITVLGIDQSEIDGAKKHLGESIGLRINDPDKGNKIADMFAEQIKNGKFAQLIYNGTLGQYEGMEANFFRTPMKEEELRTMAFSMLSPDQWEQFEKLGPLLGIGLAALFIMLLSLKGIDTAVKKLE